jgi:hypothetical protein
VLRRAFANQRGRFRNIDIESIHSFGSGLIETVSFSQAEPCTVH